MKSDFNRVLGKRDIFTLSFGAMIGWGWVVLTNDWILKAGVWGAILAFLRKKTDFLNCLGLSFLVFTN